MSEGTPAQVTMSVPIDQGEMMGRLKSKIHEFRRERDAARTEVETAKQKIAALEQELADHPAAKRAKELEQQIRAIRHRKVFEDEAAKAGVRPEGVEDLYNLSGYEAAGDMPDPTAIAALIEAQKAKRAYLFEAPEDPNAPVKPPPAKPGPASGQGTLARGNSTGFELPGNDDPRWSDVKWQWEHRVEIADAINHRLKNGVV
jgi:hypothetical protein